MTRILFALAIVSVVAARPAHAETCKAHVTTLANANTSAPNVAYWDGSKLVYVKGSKPNPGTHVFYFSSPVTPTATNLELGTTPKLPPQKAQPKENVGPCPSLATIEIAGTNETPQAPTRLSDVVKAYRTYQPAVGAQYTANSVTSITTEAVQILGQIVVDRATQQAYTLITSKAEQWLGCGSPPAAGKISFPATCAALASLRLQDLAMAPDLLRAALVSDLLAAIRTISATATGAAEVTAFDKTLAQIVPLLGRPESALTTHPADAIAHSLIDRGLTKLTAAVSPAAETPEVDQICGLVDVHEHILALVAGALATCKVSGGGTCDIMQVVAQLEAQYCGSGSGSGSGGGGSGPLDPDQLAYAESIAGHLWDALTLQKTGGSADTTERLVAALEGGFEVACMYTAAPNTAPYTCALQPKTYGLPLLPYEWVAIAHDVTIAAVNRDGAALAAAVIAALGRVLPDPTTSDVSKGLRVLATITAYAATYTGSDPSSAGAHQTRTTLLESLTADMTDRTNRNGDWIFSVGGSLRLVAGGRRSLSYKSSTSGQTVYDSAVAPVLGLPLGFAIDYLDKKDSRGFHVEIGVLDLGQYVSFDQSNQVATPDLAQALSPSLTLAYACGHSLPFFLGLTGGYTPSFDFGSGDPAAKKGAFTAGVTIGFYVPLFDFD